MPSYAKAVATDIIAQMAAMPGGTWAVTYGAQFERMYVVNLEEFAPAGDPASQMTVTIAPVGNEFERTGWGGARVTVTLGILFNVLVAVSDGQVTDANIDAYEQLVDQVCLWLVGPRQFAAVGTNTLTLTGTTTPLPTAGTYTLAGVHNGKPYYYTAATGLYVYWNGNQWTIGVALHDGFQTVFWFSATGPAGTYAAGGTATGTITATQAAGDALWSCGTPKPVFGDNYNDHLYGENGEFHVPVLLEVFSDPGGVLMGRMQNWIDYQRRHLDAAQFADFVAMEPKVKAFLEREPTIPKAVRDLEALQKQILDKVMRPGLDKASKWLAQMEKGAAAGIRDTGTLQQSIGSIAPKIYPATFCGYVASGPRRGYARTVLPVMTKKGVKLKRQSKKFTESHPTLTKKNPIEYSRYVISGRKAITSKKMLMSTAGRFFGHSVKAAPPKNFMAAAESSAPQAAAMAVAEMNARTLELKGQL